MSKIDKLTPEQEAQLEVYANKWLEIGLSTEPVDFEAAKAATIKAYQNVGLTPPTQFFVVDSPNAAINLIQKMDPKKSKKDIFNEMGYGCHDASWLGFYEYFKDVVKLDNLEKIDGLIELAKSCGWYNMYEDVVVFQHRPCQIKFDNEKRLHNDTGAAILYRDGLAVYAWHGTVIPAEWIDDPKSLTAKKALTWENIEQRRCACEILGWTKILDELDAKVINEDEDPEVGTLLEVEIPEIGPEKFLRVMCGTKREFALPVPPEMTTALEANAWTFGFDKDEFLKPEVRT